MEIFAQHLQNTLTRLTTELQLHSSGDPQYKEGSYRLWDEKQARILSDAMLNEVDRNTYRHFLDCKVEDRHVQYEFLTKLFILEPNFRKYLATETEQVKSLLLSPNMEIPFLRCMASFFGLGFFGIENSGPHKFLYAYVEDGAVDLEFDRNVFVTLPCPFDRCPKANANFLVGLMNKEIKALKTELEGRDVALKRTSANETVLKEQVSVLRADADEFALKLRKMAQELDSKHAELQKAEKRARAAEQICRVVEKPKAQLDSVRDLCSIRVHTMSPKGELEYILPKEFKLEFDPPNNILQIAEVIDYKTGVFDINLVPKLGAYSVKKVFSDGKEVEGGGPFSFTVRRDYAAIKEGQVFSNDFKGVWGVSVDNGDNIYVVDTDHHNVRIYSQKKELVRTIICAQQGSNLPYPRGVAVRDGGEIAVVCNNHGKIQLYGPGSDPVRIVGEPGHGPEQLCKPRGICYGPKGELIVVDSDNHRVQIIAFNDKQEVKIQNVGAKGAKTNQFFFPAFVARHGDRLVVTDCDNNRVVQMKVDGSQFSSFGIQGNKQGALARPTGVAVDAFGNIIVAEMGNHRVQVFDSKGVFQTFVGVDVLKDPRGLAVDSAGRIYVADFGNNRVMVF